MAWTLIQNLAPTPYAASTNTDCTVSAAFASNVTAGNRVLLYVGHNGAFTGTDINTPFDNQGNTWTRLKSIGPFGSGGDVYVELWTAVVSTTGTLTITVTAPATSALTNEVGWTAQEYAGLDSSAGAGCLDVSASGTPNVGNANNADTGTTAATHGAGQLAVCMVADDGNGVTWTLATPGGFTKVAGASIDGSFVTALAVATKVSASGATEHAVWTGGVSNTDAALVAVIKAPPFTAQTAVARLRSTSTTAQTAGARIFVNWPRDLNVRRPGPPGFISPAAFLLPPFPLIPTTVISPRLTQPAIARLTRTVTGSQAAKAAVVNTASSTQTAAARVDKDWSATDPSFLSWEDCKLNLVATPNAIGIDATQMAYVQIRKCNFAGGRYALRGQRDPAGSLHASTYTTGVTIEDCIFSQQRTLSLCNPSVLWRIVNNLFQPGGTGTVAGAIGNDGAYPTSTALAIDANYFGKANAGTYINVGQATAFRVTGNYIDGAAVPVGIAVPGGCVGGLIEGNRIVTLTGIDCTPTGGAAQVGVTVDGNTLGGCATPIATYQQTGQQIWLNGNAGVADWTPVAQTVGAPLSISALGAGWRTREGPDCKQGTIVLTAGAATVLNQSVTASSRIFLTAQDNNTTGALRVSARTAGVSFTITSTVGGDSGVIAYEIYEPVTGSQTAVQTTIARVRNTTVTAAQTGRARLGLVHSTTLPAMARLGSTTTVTAAAAARVLNPATRSTQQAKTAVTNTATASQTAVARLIITAAAAQSSLSRLAVAATATTTATATIAASTAQTARAAVLNTATRTATAKAAILRTATGSQTATARIIDFNQQSIQNAVAHIQTTGSAAQTATATVQ